MHLKLSIIGALFICSCVMFYFSIELERSSMAELGISAFFDVGVMLFAGLMCSYFSYACATGKVDFSSIDENTYEDSSKARQTLNNPAFINKLCLYISYLAPYLIGALLIFEALN